MVWNFKETPFLRKRWGFFIPRPKIDRLLLLLIPIILPLLLLSSPAYAEIKTFVEEYTYQASEYDSKVSCRALALEQVKRLLLEKLGTYLESETEVRNFQLTRDQIITLTAGIVRSEIIDEKWDGKTYFLKAKIETDPKDVTNSINKLRQDRQQTKELEETRKKAEEALLELEKLRKEMGIAKPGKSIFDDLPSEEVRKAGRKEQDQYQNAVNRLSAIDWVEEGRALGNAGKWREAIEAINKAIELNPRNALTFYSRGYAYSKLGDHQREIRDYDRAIELDPKFAGAYINRGAAYNELGEHHQAIRDCDRAIELNPKDAKAYINRGAAYNELGEHHQAIRDYDKAIELNPRIALTYGNRGVAYWMLGNSEQAIEDFKMAARLGDKESQDFLKAKGISW